MVRLDILAGRYKQGTCDQVTILGTTVEQLAIAILHARPISDLADDDTLFVPSAR